MTPPPLFFVCVVCVCGGGGGADDQMVLLDTLIRNSRPITKELNRYNCQHVLI